MVEIFSVSGANNKVKKSRRSESGANIHCLLPSQTCFSWK